MKRTFAILLCAVLALSGCAQAAAPTASADVTATVAATPTPDGDTAQPDATAEAGDEDPAPDAELGTQPPDDGTPADAYTPDGTKSVTTGLEKKSPYKPVAVMIENTVPARPQKGLGQADIVYEVLVENASMTRFMCVFNDNMPKTAGPVRSSRPYYIDLADEFGGAYCFFGGPEYKPASIYTRLEKSPLKIVANGITGKWGKYYWRSKDKAAPHNVYTDLTRIAELFEELPAAKHFLFDAAATPVGDDVTKIEVPYNKSTLDTVYTYDAASKKYLRSVNGKPFVDGLDNQQIAVTNVIVQNTKLEFTGDYKGRVEISFIGKGEADVFTAGKHIKATWEKKSAAEPTVYRDSNGKEIVLQPGNTWVQVVYSKIKYTYGN